MFGFSVVGAIQDRLKDPAKLSTDELLLCHELLYSMVRCAVEFRLTPNPWIREKLAEVDRELAKRSPATGGKG